MKIDLPHLTNAEAKIYLLLWRAIMSDEAAKIFFHTRCSGKTTVLKALEDSFKGVRQEPANSDLNPFLK